MRLLLLTSRMARWLKLTSLSLLLVAAADPRPELIDLQLKGDFDSALRLVEEWLAKQPETARSWGFEYLRGHLLDHQQQRPAAIDSFVASMNSVPLLADFSRYRLAADRFESNQPQMVAGLLAPLLAKGPPEALTDSVVALMNRSMAAGADCRLLENWETWELDRTSKRRLLASVIECDQGQDTSATAADLWYQLLMTERSDETARRAAVRLAREAPSDLDRRTSLLVGLTLFDHREFDRAIPFLESSLLLTTGTSTGIRGVEIDDVLYAIARSFYWQGEYAEAAERFARLAEQSDDPEQVARALFQRGRSLALLGSWDGAVESYRSAADADPTGSWAAAALISAMRLEWRQGREAAATGFLDRLRSRSGWRSTLERATLFLAVSDIVTGRSERAAAWLDQTRQAARTDRPEIWYWRGRLAELQEQYPTAVRSYASLMASEPYHPLSESARSRLRQPGLDERARQLGEQLAQSSRSADLLRARMLLDDAHPGHRAATLALIERGRRSTGTRLLIEQLPPEPATGSLWRDEPREPEELLLGLGIAEVDSAALRRAFPLADTSLALSGSRLMATSGLHRRSLFYAEVVAKRIPTHLPEPLIAGWFRRLLHPRPYDLVIEQQARRFGVDPDLLRAIIREESRFDPMAVSAASARGLTQFVLPTARRLGQKLGWQQLDAWDLHAPQTAITLGAAYLAELDRRFHGKTVHAIAAYNAGEDLARLWQAYCFSEQPEEYLSKVGYRQTREYLAKVLASRSQYREIYGDGPETYSAWLSRTSMTGGSAP